MVRPWHRRGGPIRQQGRCPRARDYDKDGDTDRAIYRPSTGHWFIQGAGATQYGSPGDIPQPGDYDNDGDTDRAIYRPTTGQWFVPGGGVVQYGTSGDVPVVLPYAIRSVFFPGA